MCNLTNNLVFHHLTMLTPFHTQVPMSNTFGYITQTMYVLPSDATWRWLKVFKSGAFCLTIDIPQKLPILKATVVEGLLFTISIKCNLAVQFCLWYPLVWPWCISKFWHPKAICLALLEFFLNPSPDVSTQRDVKVTLWIYESFSEYCNSWHACDCKHKMWLLRPLNLLVFSTFGP